MASDTALCSLPTVRITMLFFITAGHWGAGAGA